MDLKNKVIEFWKRYFSSETPLENRITYILVLIAFIASTYGFITTITLNLANVSVIISSVNLAISILLLLFISKSKNLYASLVLVCIYFGNIMFPLMFLTEGGSDAGMGYYFMLVPVIMTLLFKTKHRIIAITLTIIEYVILFLISRIFPSFIIPLPEDKITSDICSAIVGTSFFIYLFCKLYACQYEKNKEKINELSEIVETQSTEDVLTSLCSRRFFKKILLHLLPAVTNKNSLYLVMFDIDNFSALNDVCGFEYGDEVLVKVADVLKKYKNEKDIVCRYGGEEFLLLIPNESKTEVINTVQNIIDDVRHFIKWKDDEKAVTVSAGVTSYIPQEAYADFLDKADALMYDAKAQGKDRLAYD